MIAAVTKRKGEGDKLKDRVSRMMNHQVSTYLNIAGASYDNLIVSSCIVHDVLQGASLRYGWMFV